MCVSVCVCVVNLCVFRLEKISRCCERICLAFPGFAAAVATVAAVTVSAKSMCRQISSKRSGGRENYLNSLKFINCMGGGMYIYYR